MVRPMWERVAEVKAPGIITLLVVVRKHQSFLFNHTPGLLLCTLAQAQRTWTSERTELSRLESQPQHSLEMCLQTFNLASLILKVSYLQYLHNQFILD